MIRRIYYMNNHLSIDAIQTNIDTIEKNQDKIKDYFGSINSILEQSVYGHKDAKRQVERIIGQWINGEKDEADFYFEFKIEVDEITKDVSLIVSDFSEEDELEESKLLWENLVSDLKQVLGSA